MLHAWLIFHLFLFPAKREIKDTEVIYTPTDVYVVMEYCKYGELYYYIVEKGRLEEAEAHQIFQQVLHFHAFICL
jgi:5'-AMP-activated protein kinase, catalytic alpha subunit